MINDDESLTLNGTVHGNRIDLSSSPGLLDGAEVEVVIRIKPPLRKWGDGLLRCAGALAESWTDADDRILAEIAQAREQSAFRELPE